MTIYRPWPDWIRVTDERGVLDSGQTAGRQWRTADNRYRYALWREWSPQPVPRFVVFVMLNPSLGSHAADDATLRRCRGFAERDGFTGLAVVNLFAYRATYPADLRGVPDPVGCLNDEATRRVVSDPAVRMVVAAWGAHAAHPRLSPRRAHVLASLDRPLWCLGTGAAGEPKHPLRLPAATPFTAYR